MAEQNENALSMQTVQGLAQSAMGLKPEEVEAAVTASKNVSKLGDAKALATWICQLTG